MRALAILGPKANEQDLAPFRAPGAEIVPTENLEAALTRQAADAVLVLGGDGTVQRQLAALMRIQLPLLVVPSGSGNDLARGLGLRTREKAREAWRAFVGGAHKVRKIDLGVLQFAPPGGRAAEALVYFACAAGTGVDAEGARRANSLPAWLRGNGGYFITAVSELMSFAPQPMNLLAGAQDGSQGRAICEPGILAAFANAPWYGHGMRIAPGAELDDGQLEICFVRGLGKLRLLRLFPKVYRGNHIGLREVEYFRAARVRVESERPLAVHADGEVVGATPVEVSVLPRALPVIVDQSK